MPAIWLPEEHYPRFQRSQINTNHPASTELYPYCVAEFTKTYVFPDAPGEMRFRVRGAAQFFLFVNGEFVGLGPASAGGDFLTDEALPWAFENEYAVSLPSPHAEIRAFVRLQPEALTEYTNGRGFFQLEGNAGDTLICTDETWSCRVDTRFVNPTEYDETRPEDAWTTAQRVEVPVRFKRYDLPNLQFDPIPGDQFALSCGKTREIELSRIYSAYFRIRVSAACTVKVTCFELSGQRGESFTLKFADAGEFTSLRMLSVGGARLTMLENEANIEISFLFSHYPAEIKGTCETSDNGLNNVMDVCRWTLGLCRQTMHLDSPLHQELLACTGDYYIEMLMTVFESGDMRLADLDVRRTAMWLDAHDGRMFHTTYSLIWVQMLKKLYWLTGNRKTVKFCFTALQKLLNRFETYENSDGIVENAPDYMFVDWTVICGYSMHHPPRALGQAVLNAFYYQALRDAAELAAVIGEDGTNWSKRADKLRDAFHKAFWDEEKQLYTDGQDTPDLEQKPWRPENPKELRHFSRYPQALAALYGLCDESMSVHLASAAASDANDLPAVQPYFMHFVLEAVMKANLSDEFALPILRKWIPMCTDCPKGLQEGWIKPEEGYQFDHSHAWGGTPAYHLPLLLTGLEIITPGMRKIRLHPNLFGLDFADIHLPTPFGTVKIHMEAGRSPEIHVPDGIECEIV